MNRKRIAWAVPGVALLALLGVVAYQYAADPGADRAGVAVTDVAAQVRQGEYLTRAGNCMACHTSRGGAQYAGGRAIETPFGAIYSSNLTPDRETGIGTWTSDDF